MNKLDNKLMFPNKYKIDFNSYFDVNKKLEDCPFFLIPCKYNQRRKKVECDKNKYQLIMSNVINLRTNFFEDEKSDINLLSKKECFDFLVEDSTKNGFNDLIIGYYDLVKDEFVQCAYIDNFEKVRSYSIINYIFIERAEFFYQEIAYLKRKLSLLNMSDFVSESVLSDTVSLLAMDCNYRKFTGAMNKENVVKMTKSILSIIYQVVESEMRRIDNCKELKANENVSNEENVANLLRQHVEELNLNQIKILFYLKDLKIVDFYVDEEENLRYIERSDDILTKEKGKKIVFSYTSYFLELLKRDAA